MNKVRKTCVTELAAERDILTTIEGEVVTVVQTGGPLQEEEVGEDMEQAGALQEEEGCKKEDMVTTTGRGASTRQTWQR